MTDEAMPLLDRAIAHARAGSLGMQSVLWTFAASTVYVPSAGEPGDDFSGFRPVYYPGASSDSQMLAVFTGPDAADDLRDVAPFLLTFTGEQLVKRMPATIGMVVNPGTTLGFDIQPDGLNAFRREITG